MRQVGFIGPAYTLPSLNVECQRLVNFFVSVNELGTGKNHEVASLVSVPGLLIRRASTGVGNCRGFYKASNGRMFGVLGVNFWELNYNGVPTTVRGTVPGEQDVSMTDNGIHLAVVNGQQGYLFKFTDNTFAEIADAEFPDGASSIAFMDGYLITNVHDTRNFQISGLYDATSWDGLDIGAKEGKPDNLKALLVDHKELLLIGSQSYEFWFNSGDPSFPFARVQGAFGEHGISAVHTLRRLDNGIFWLSQDENGAGIVVRVNGYTPTRVSNFAVEADIKSLGDVSGASAWTYQDAGHSFYVLNLPFGKRSWVLDVASGLWHERVSLDAQGGETRSRAQHHIFTGVRHMVGDYLNDAVYELRNDCYTDGNSPLLGLRAAPHFGGEKRITHNSFRLDMETGVGLEDGSDPQVMMQYSDDGGHQWSNEKWASAGKIGERKLRVMWSRLGMARDRVYRVKITDPVPRTLISSFLDVEAER